MSAGPDTEMNTGHDIETRLSRMAVGHFDQDDVDWLTGLYTELTEAISGLDFKAARDCGLYDVLARQGLAIPFDKLHHAPMCPANHYHRQRQPSGWCSCGAAEHEAQKQEAQGKAGVRP